ncbi:Tn3 family transposase [uncultured Nitrosomonas sp.]|uniref:Tn3 family transposase n=1 Tax=uncultured Nitrosomonas sp. TaxID=156424 RepID=UPI0025E8EC17|nr:Tn3 family transposase [uncultured Nitrosomonas sp.]
MFGLEKSFQPVEQDNAYYSALEIKSRKLQNRIAGILKSAEFTGHKELVNAIRYFQTKDIMESTAPVGFLSDQEQEYLRDDKGNFRIFLYKAVLFLKVAEALKSGSLSLPYSYKYCELNDYLISEKQWHAKRNVYIKQACLEDLVDIEKSLSISGNELKASYEKVNQLISQEKTPYITCRTDGSFIIRTPKLEEKETYSISNILPHKKDVPIQDVLSVISEQTRFSDQFIHDTLSMQYQRREDKALFAALIAYGCSVGIPRMARITRGQGQSILENIARQYMHIDNIKRANDSVLKKLDEIADYFNASNLRHTSNDGQKITLMAAHSTPVFRTNITAQEKELAVTSSWMIVSPISMRLSYRLQNGRPVMYWMG